MEVLEDDSKESKLTSEEITIKDGDLYKIQIIDDSTIILKKQCPKQIWEGN